MTKILSEQIQEGDLLPGLDDAYVFDVRLDAEVTTFNTGLNALLGTFNVITFLTAEGDEAYLILPNGVPVEVDR